MTMPTSLTATTLAYGSSSAPGGALIPLAMVAVVVFLLLQFYFHHRRHKQAQEWAAERGWSYTKSDRSYTKFSSGAPFGQGHSRSATKILTGTLNGPGTRRVTSFTLSWTEGSGKDSTNYDMHVVAVDLGLNAPLINLGPENFLSRRFGRDIQFELEEFNREWRVTSPDERFAHGVIHPRMMELLMTPAYKRQSFRYENRYLLTWLPGKTNLDRIIPTATSLARLADQMPNYKYDQR